MLKQRACGTCESDGQYPKSWVKRCWIWIKQCGRLQRLNPANEQSEHLCLFWLLFLNVSCRNNESQRNVSLKCDDYIDSPCCTRTLLIFCMFVLDVNSQDEPCLRLAWGTSELFPSILMFSSLMCILSSDPEWFFHKPLLYLVLIS